MVPFVLLVSILKFLPPYAISFRTMGYHGDFDTVITVTRYNVNTNSTELFHQEQIFRIMKFKNSGK